MERTILHALYDLLPSKDRSILSVPTSSSSSSVSNEKCNIVMLNMVKGYTSHLKLSIKEHMQNWRDQCWKLAASHMNQHHNEDFIEFPTPIMKYEYFHNFCGSEENAELWSAYYNNGDHTLLLGWALQINSSPRHIVLFNADTVLSTDILRFGHTSKRNEPYLAGFFGDGMKPEVNRLVTSGAQLVYRTGMNVWNFGFDSSNSMYCRVESNTSATHVNCTLIELINIPYDGPFIDPDTHLFLQPEESMGLTYSCTLRDNYTQDESRIKILFDEKFKFQLFLHGISVSDQLDFSFGIDYNARINSEMGLGRDRNYVNQSFFNEEILKACSQIQSEGQCPKDILNLLRTRVFQSLLKNSNYISLGLRNDKHLSEFLYESFILECAPQEFREVLNNLNQPSSFELEKTLIPMNQFIDKHDIHDAELLNIDLIKISNKRLLETIQNCSRCPTMKSVRSKFAKHYICLPELIVDEIIPPYPEDIVNHVEILEWPSIQDQEVALKLRNLVVQLVQNEDLLPEWAVRFKQFPEGAQPRPITPITLEDTTFFMVDITQFTAEKVHQRLAKEDPSFSCNGGSCGCIDSSFLDELLNSLESVSTATIGMKRKVEKRLRRLLMGKFSQVEADKFDSSQVRSDPNSPTPRSPYQNDNTLNSSATSSSSDHNTYNNSESNSFNNSISKSSNPSSYSNDSNTTRNDNNNTKDYQPSSSSRSKKRKRNENNEDESIEEPDYSQNICDQALNSIRGTSQNFNHTIKQDHIFQAAQESKTVLRYCTESQEKLNLKKSDFITDILNSSRINVSCYINPDTQEEAVSLVKDFEYLAIIVGQIWVSVFEEEVSGSLLNIFFDKSNLIAFNQQGHLYFNVHYLIKLHQMNVESLIIYWFVVFCHELAHNEAQSHGKHHESIEETLLWAYLPKLIKELETMKTALNFAHNSN
eukprot:gb/GECH01006424.1/.p1 GENE.gb/GECH01006424.1/~~gb/GECH01006424.1/.p1  ORF type:complete len:930 (+),score=199.32 gb/GECH01006424.1/:1-2790(+)